MLAHDEVDARIKEIRELLAAGAAKSPALSCSPDKLKAPNNSARPPRLMQRCQTATNEKLSADMTAANQMNCSQLSEQ